jgi:hypothetical protein
MAHQKPNMKTTLIKLRTLAIFVGFSVFLLGAAIIPATFVAAADEADATKAAETQVQNAPQPFSASTVLPRGTVVQIDEQDTKKVEPATIEHLDKMFGLVVPIDNLPITVTGGGSGQTYVATAGRYKAIVTNENGAIKAGDPVTVSNLKGTLMKATDKQEILFGKALGSFDGTNNSIGQSSLKYNTGGTKTVSLAMIEVAIDIKHNPDVQSTKTKLPPQLERLGEQIAEKELSPFRIYLSIALVIISIVISAVVMTSGIRSSILAIGRNPLSKSSIFKSLLQVIFTGFIILIIGLFTVYLLLKL